IQPLRPIYRPEKIARAVVRLAEHPRRELFAGAAGCLASIMHAVAPGFYEGVAARVVEREHLQEKHAPATPGNVFESMPQFTSISGGWSDQLRLSGTRWILRGASALAAVAVIEAVAVVV